LGGQPLFTATDSSSKAQPITAPPQTITLSAKTTPATGYMVVIGTGKFYEATDISTVDPQAIYGIWDPLAFGASTIPAGVANTSKSLLTVQTITPAAPVNGVAYFNVSTNMVDYVGKTTPTVVPPRRGWLVNLPNSGERLVYPMELLLNRVIGVGSISPANGVVDPCNANGAGTGYRYFIDGLSGGGLDTTINGVVNVNGYTTAADGRDVILQLKDDPYKVRVCSAGDPDCPDVGFNQCQIDPDSCKKTSRPKIREWRQLFMR
jgi:type IV pilus assembly protein PilY1